MNKVSQIIKNNITLSTSETLPIDLKGYLKSIGIYSLDSDINVSIGNSTFKVIKGKVLQLNKFYEDIDNVKIVGSCSIKELVIDYIYEYKGGESNG